MSKKTERHDFEPKILGFVCKWCTYSGADLAGTSRMDYSPNVRMVRLPCSGRIDPQFLIKAFEQGADGVIVSGCHPGDCHYNEGNYYARRRNLAFRELLEFNGIDVNRLEFSWISAAEAIKWTQVINKFTKQVRELGPHAAYGELIDPYAGRLVVEDASA
ncbi:MAG: hydrogenase iron-sulfur subunit [Sedimenticola sp.]